MRSVSEVPDHSTIKPTIDGFQNLTKKQPFHIWKLIAIVLVQGGSDPRDCKERPPTEMTIFCH